MSFPTNSLELLRLFFPRDTEGRLQGRLRDIAKPNWKELRDPGYRGIHDWRKYIVISNVEKVWKTMPEPAKVSAYALAVIRADSEEWD